MNRSILNRYRNLKAKPKTRRALECWRAGSVGAFIPLLICAAVPEEAPLFRRSKPEVAPVDLPTKEGGKGRPTPSRRESQEAAKARAKGAQGRGKKLTGAEIREGMRTGDERLLPLRDRGPVKRFIRDYVDTRFSITELMIPILVATLIMGYTGNAALQRAGNGIMAGTMLVVIYDVLMLRRRIRREVTARFPGESLKGTFHYSLIRLMQLRFLRQPKTQVKVGQTLPDTYR